MRQPSRRLFFPSSLLLYIFSLGSGTSPTVSQGIEGGFVIHAHVSMVMIVFAE